MQYPVRLIDPDDKQGQPALHGHGDGLLSVRLAAAPSTEDSFGRAGCCACVNAGVGGRISHMPSCVKRKRVSTRS